MRALLATVVTAGLSSAFAGETADVSSQPIPLQTEQSPNRPKPIVELGNPFLAQGLIGPGFTLPTGATWQPALLVFGSYRSVMQAFDTEGGNVSEWFESPRSVRRSHPHWNRAGAPRTSAAGSNLS